MYGPPKDVEGECNARLFIGDDYGDNSSTMRCSLPPKHEPPHCKKYHNESSGDVVVTWQRDAREVCPDCKQRVIDRTYWIVDPKGDFAICEPCYRVRQSLDMLEEFESKEFIEAIKNHIAEGYEGTRDLLILFHEAEYANDQKEMDAIRRDLHELLKS